MYRCLFGFGEDGRCGYVWVWSWRCGIGVAGGMQSEKSAGMGKSRGLGTGNSMSSTPGKARRLAMTIGALLGDVLGRLRERFDEFKMRWFRDWIPVLTHGCQVHLHRLSHSLPCLLKCSASRHATWEIGRVCAIPCGRLFEEDREFVHGRPACFIIDFWVLGGTSSESCPATVTFPGFAG